MVPTDCLMIQEPLVTRGMSLKVLLRRVCASLLSPPARNLPMRPSRSAEGKPSSTWDIRIISQVGACVFSAATKAVLQLHSPSTMNLTRH